MAEDATRRLLKIFGIAVTDFEEKSTRILERAKALVDTGGNPSGFLPLFEELCRASRDLNTQWMEVTEHIIEAQNHAYSGLLRIAEEARRKSPGGE